MMGQAEDSTGAGVRPSPLGPQWGSDNDFDKLVQIMMAHAERRGFSSDEADEAIGAVWEQVAVAESQGRLSVLGPRARRQWALTTFEHLLMRRIRSRQRERRATRRLVVPRPSEGESNGSTVPEEGYSLSERREATGRILSELAPELAALIAHCGRPAQEIADEMGISPQEVYARMRRLRKEIARIIAELGISPELFCPDEQA